MWYLIVNTLKVTSAIPSKNTVSANKKQHILPLNIPFVIIHFCGKRMYVHNVKNGRYCLKMWKRIDRLLSSSGIFQGK